MSQNNNIMKCPKCGNALEGLFEKYSSNETYTYSDGRYKIKDFGEDYSIACIICGTVLPKSMENKISKLLPKF